MATHSSAASFILRIYFAVVSAVTLFTLMFGAIDLLTIGLRQIIPGANQPEYGLEDCSNLTDRWPVAKTVDATAAQTATVEPTEEELRAACEARNADTLRNWQSQQAANTVRNIALIIISLPLFIIHFRVVYKDWKAERE
jgi:hypothetical protein